MRGSGYLIDDHGVMRGKQNICVLAAVSFYQQRQQFWRTLPSSRCGVLFQAVAAVAFLAFSSDQEHGVLGSLFQPPGAVAAAVYSEQHVFFSRAEPPAAAATTSHPIDATSCLSGVVLATVAVGASMTYWASHRGQMPWSFVVGDWCLLMSTCHYALVRDIDNLYKTLKKNIKEIDKDAKFYDNMSSKMDKPSAEECWSEIEAWEHGCRQCTG